MTAEEIASFESFGEGLVFLNDSVGFVSDLAAGRINRFTTSGELVEWARAEMPIGHEILRNGVHIVADLGTGALLLFDRHGSPLPPVLESDRGPLVSPNDLALDPHGGVYFTDPRDSWVNQPRGRVHYLSSDGDVSTAADSLEWPNGIAVTPAGDAVFVNESTSGRILRFEITSPGVLGEPELFAEVKEGLLPTAEAQQTLDGMAFDRDGNLFVAYHRIGQILVLDPSAEIVRRYDAGQLSVSNVAFAGPEPGTLYAVGALGGDGTRGVITRLELAGVSGWRQFDPWPLSAR